MNFHILLTLHFCYLKIDISTILLSVCFWYLIIVHIIMYTMILIYIACKSFYR